MAKSLFKVKFELRTMDDGDEKSADWQMQDAVTVLSDEDARSAVAKVERKLVPGEFKWEDDEGKKHTTKNIGFRLTSVEHLHDVDYP